MNDKVAWEVVNVIESFLTTMENARLQEIAMQPDAPFLGAGTVSYTHLPRAPFLGDVLAEFDPLGGSPREVGQDAVRDARHQHDEKRDVDDQQALQECFFVLHVRCCSSVSWANIAI